MLAPDRSVEEPSFSLLAKLFIAQGPHEPMLAIDVGCGRLFTLPGQDSKHSVCHQLCGVALLLWAVSDGNNGNNGKRYVKQK